MKQRMAFDRPDLVLAGAFYLGMALTGVLIRFFASEAQGHGVPQVMNALIKRGGIIRWPIGVVKVIASILTVGSGGSAGTEGPVVQIGATVGSVVGQRLHMTREHMGTLVGCGAAAGRGHMRTRGRARAGRSSTTLATSVRGARARRRRARGPLCAGCARRVRGVTAI